LRNLLDCSITHSSKANKDFEQGYALLAVVGDADNQSIADATEDLPTTAQKKSPLDRN
jgi:hypothetical protein